MKSEDIKLEGPRNIDPGVMDIAVWLKEIAYQLAVMNEANVERDKPIIQVDHSRPSEIGIQQLLPRKENQ